MGKISTRGFGGSVKKAKEELPEVESVKELPWKLSEGTQTLAAESEADEVFFGGKAGGGKGQSCYGMGWAFRNIKNFSAECYGDITSLVPKGIRDMDSKVLMWNGAWKDFSEVKVGDRIMNPDGQSQEIIQVHERGFQPMYRVSFEDGTNVECDGDHLWGVWAARQNSQQKTCRGRKEVLANDSPANWNVNYILRARTRDAKWLYEEASKGRRFIIPIAAPMNYTNLHHGIAERAYLYGALLGDESISTICAGRGIKLFTVDEHIKQRSLSILQDEAFVALDERRNTAFWSINIKDKWVHSWARDQGLLGTHSHDKFIPPGHLKESLAFRWNLAQGLFDTDGYASMAVKSEVSYCTVSPQLAEDVAALVRSLGYMAKIRPKQGVYIITVEGNDRWRLFSLPRKVDAAKSHEPNIWVGKSIKSIEQIDETYCRCITVSNPNGLYITDDFNVTHNSALLLILAATQHRRSIIFRRTYPNLKGMIEKSKEFLQGIARYNSTDKLWRGIPGDRTLEFGSMEYEDDKEKYRGNEHDLKCVGAGTLVWMADGTLKPIESIEVGDCVMTLEGDRRVTFTFRKVKPAVLVKALCGDRKVGSQVQSFSHELLLNNGEWSSYEKPSRSMPQGLALLASRQSLKADQQNISNTEPWTYIHPYTKEARQSSFSKCKPCSVHYFELGYSLMLFDITVEGMNHYITDGGFINRNCYDELTELSQSQFEFTSAWCRTTIPGQQCKIVATFNPPSSRQGMWIIKKLAPWLDSKYDGVPAEPGELRWYIRSPDTDDEVEVPSGEAIQHGDETLQPRSRTFIPSSLDDNPHLKDSGYRAMLQGLPDPLRSQLLYGDFNITDSDDAWQIIPTAWARAAIARWKENPAAAYDAVGVDVSRGGKDETIIAPRMGFWIDTLRVFPGIEIPDGEVLAGHVISCVTSRRTSINIDIIGVGYSPYDSLKRILGKGQKINGLNGGESSLTVDGDRKTDRTELLGFANRRAEWWWNLRELLDPRNGHDVALPDDDKMLADLTTPRWIPVAISDPESTIKSLVRVETKDEIKRRLKGGRSPDRGDAIVYAFAPVDDAENPWEWMSGI